MSNQIRIIGHAWNRVFTYTDNKKNSAGQYICREIKLPGGSPLLARLLEIDVNASVTSPTERLRLYKYITEAQKNYYSVECSMGVLKGDALLKSYGDGETSVVWAESSITLPDNGKVLFASKDVLPVKKQLKHIDFLLLSADLLRKEGAKISMGASWERTCIDLLRQLRFHTKLKEFHKVPKLLITFAEDGAVLFEKDAKGKRTATLFLTHGKNERSLRYDKATAPGILPDTFLVMTASIAQQFAAGKLCVGQMLAAGAAFLAAGYQLSEDAFGINDGILAQDDCCAAGINIPMDAKSGLVDDNWNIAGQNVTGYASTWDMLTETNYFYKGIPAVIPRLQFKELTTVDRWEIERFQDIYNLIREYDEKVFASGDDIKPLSFAVFGPPGAGKSFGIKQILKTLGDTFQKLEFNVSQFRSENDVTAVFQQVRSEVLRGKLPIVFFDEFDSARDNNNLGWLKSFLMPMQDGKIYDDGIEQPIGKCILVFAGGTAETFSLFQKHKEMEDADYRHAKAPDFISRLRGTLDILGPNEQDNSERDNNDENYLLRRAVLLCGLLVQRNLHLTQNVHEAMLLVPKYLHGARSMEQILEMSHPVNGEINAAGLPSEAQLAIHVDAKEFLRILELDVSEEGIMAQKIHKLYCSHLKTTEEKARPQNKAWEKLSMHYKQDNLRQLRKYSEWAELLGGRIGYICEEGETIPQADINEFAELHAHKEHDDWMDNKKKNGYVYGPIRSDDPPKTHPLMKPWSELEENDRNRDRNPIREMPQVLAEVGKCIYRVVD